MITLDYSTLREFHDLQDTKVFNYLADRLEQVKENLVNCSEESAFRTLQGKAQMLFEIIELSNTAYAKAEAMKQTKIDTKNMF